MLFEDTLLVRYADVLRMRQFATEAAIIAALQPGECIWLVESSFTRPDRIAPMALVLYQEYDDQGKPTVVVRKDLTNPMPSRWYVSDMQRIISQGVFTEEALAIRYFEKIQRIYNFDAHWQHHVQEIQYMNSLSLYELQ